MQSEIMAEIEAKQKTILARKRIKSGDAHISENSNYTLTFK